MGTLYWSGHYRQCSVPGFFWVLAAVGTWRVLGVSWSSQLCSNLLCDLWQVFVPLRASVLQSTFPKALLKLGSAGHQVPACVGHPAKQGR